MDRHSVRRIRVAQLTLGMYLVKFEGGWLASPFWTSGFLLEQQEDLDLAHHSSVRYCWIDTRRGADVAPARQTPPAPAPIAPAAPAAPARVAARAVPALSLAAELPAARALCSKACGAVAAIFEQARLGNATDAGAAGALVEDIVGSVERHPTALITLARLKTGDNYTYLHSVAVCALMVALAKAMGLDADQVREAGLGGLLHDIGKARIPLDILNKPGALDATEMATVRRHPEHAHHALRGDGTGESVRQICLHHHERADGRGYPAGLAGAAIPLMARMAAVCDVYDAVTSERPYKGGWDPAQAVSRMISWPGHFDPAILAAFIDVVGIYPTGSLVRLGNQRLAVVVEHKLATLTKPLVRVFYCTRTQQMLPLQDVDLAAPGAPALLGREARNAWPAAFIEQLWIDPALALREAPQAGAPA